MTINCNDLEDSRGIHAGAGGCVHATAASDETAAWFTSVWNIGMCDATGNETCHKTSGFLLLLRSRSRDGAPSTFPYIFHPEIAPHFPPLFSAAFVIKIWSKIKWRECETTAVLSFHLNPCQPFHSVVNSPISQIMTFLLEIFNLFQNWNMNFVEEIVGFIRNVLFNHFWDYFLWIYVN